MQKETVYFSINFHQPSPHPSYHITCNFVGMAECQDLGGDEDLEIEIKKLYIGCDLNVGDTPLAYTELDQDVEYWYNTEAYKEILRDICERFGTDNDEPADAVSVCEYYQKKKELEWAKELKVSFIK